MKAMARASLTMETTTVCHPPLYTLSPLPDLRARCLGATQWLARDAERDGWRFAPLNTPQPEGVAPAWFGLAECDPLVDDGIAYADKLRAAGVPADLEIYRGVTHEFIKMGRALPEARQAHADAAGALQRAFAP